MSTNTLPLLTALSLPAVTTFPSAECIQWTDDGQAIVLSASAAFILTPDSGINVERGSVIKPPLDYAILDGYRPLGWLRTMIEWDKSVEVHPWAAECDEWGSIALGSLDLAFVGATSSPSNLTEKASCVIALLNSNAEASIYRADKNHLTGKWIRVTSLLEPLRRSAEQTNAESSFQTVLHMQANCIAWSPQANFGISPSPDVDGSLLAIGNRAGRVCLFRYDGDGEVKSVATIDVADRWITRLSWTEWRSSQRGLCEALIACAVADGSVVVLRISQTLTSTPLESAFVAQTELTVAHEIHSDQPCKADKRNVTSLRWINVPNREPILVFSKPGTLHIWTTSSPSAPWFGMRTMLLKTQNLSVGSSSLSPVSGIEHLHSQDALVVSLADGSFHVVLNLSTDPQLSPGLSDNGLTSHTVSAMARAHFIKSEEEPMKKFDVNAIHGMSTYDTDSFSLWIHEAFRPTDFNYKHDAKHTTMFIVAQLWNGSADEVLLSRLDEMLAHPRAYLGAAPISVLRPLFLHLQNPDVLARVHTSLIERLQRQAHPDDSALVVLPTWTTELTPALRVQFCTSLRTHLFGWDSFLAQRLQVSLAAFCQATCGDPIRQREYEQALAGVVGSLLPHILRIIIRHIVAVLGVLTPNDVPFVMRIVVKALLPGTPDDVAAEAQNLSRQVQVAVPADHNVTSSTFGLEELCPACRAPVPLADITTAQCPNGHVWARCSITSFILSTPMVRTCTGCSRKAFLAPPPRVPGSSAQTWLPPAAQSWLVEELLHAVRRCFFCGNSFITVV